MVALHTYAFSRDREVSDHSLGRKFYGHSYTAPTPRIHFLQQFGLACTKAFAIHLRRPTRTQQAPQASSGTARAPPGLSSPFSTDPRV
eukprot:scaffold3542_cov104-Skeletonema_marinoi.AAC.3